MKTKTSVTLSEEVLSDMDRHMDQFKNRSDFIEQAVIRLLQQMDRERRNARDLEVLNRHANRLNKEALDTLAYQGDV